MLNPCHRHSPPDSKRFRYLAAALPATGLLFIGSGAAWAAQDITLDFVRHGESLNQAQHVLHSTLPGDGLSETGQEQAQATAQEILAEYSNGIAGIYASDAIRAQETAVPLAEALNMDMQILSGINEINAGIFEGVPMNNMIGALFFAAPLAWILGNPWVPLAGSSDYNGMAFQDRFSDAVQTIYDNTVANEGPPIDVVYAHEGSILAWTMMNVENPDFSVIFGTPIDSGGHVAAPLLGGGQVVVEGNPVDGWTLTSWAGTPVPEDPGLMTDLFVDVRDLVMAPQMAAYEIQQGLLHAIGSGDPTPFVDAIQSGFNDVGNALFQFPTAVIHDIVDAVQGLGTDVAGTVPGEVGATIADAFTSI